MQELIEKLGVNWRLLLAQTVNFLIVLAVLRLTVYKPLLSMLRTRQEKIQQGMEDADNAKKHLDEVEVVGKKRLAEVEKQALEVIAQSENKAKETEAQIVAQAKTKEGDILTNAEKLARAKKEESENAFYKEAAEVVKNAVAKTAQLSPSVIDEALVQEAIKGLKKDK